MSRPYKKRGEGGGAKTRGLYTVELPWGTFREFPVRKDGGENAGHGFSEEKSGPGTHRGRSTDGSDPLLPTSKWGKEKKTPCFLPGGAVKRNQRALR